MISGDKLQGQRCFIKKRLAVHIFIFGPHIGDVAGDDGKFSFEFGGFLKDLSQDRGGFDKKSAFAVLIFQ